MRDKPFPVGAVVVAHGLSNNKFNGKKGKIKKYQKDRVVVTFPPPDNDCALKIENIKAADGQKPSREPSLQSSDDHVKRDPRDSPQRKLRSSRSRSPPRDDRDRRGRRRRAEGRSRDHTRGRERHSRRRRRRNRSVSSSWESSAESESSYTSRSDRSETPVSGTAGGDKDMAPQDASSDVTEEYEEDRWIRVGVTGGEPSLDEVYWMFTQFGQVTHVMDSTIRRQPGDPKSYFVAMRTRFYDAMAYVRGKEVQFAGGAATLQCSACGEPQRGNMRDYTAVNGALRELLMNVNSDDAAEGLEVFFKSNQWVPKDFVWARWVAGEGWLQPRQAEAEFRKMPRRLKVDERYVHIGSLWESATVDAVYNIAALYSHVECATPLKKSPNSTYAIVKCRDKIGARSLMKHLNGVAVGEKRLRVDLFTGVPGQLKFHNRPPRKPLPPCPTAPSRSLLLPRIPASQKQQLVHLLNYAGAVKEHSDGLLLSFPTPGAALIFLSQHHGRNFHKSRIEMQFVDDDDAA